MLVAAEIFIVMRKGKRELVSVGIFGTYGFGNMGDAAVADATILGIRRYLHKARIVGICQQPINAKLRHNIDSFSIFSDFIQPSAESGVTIVSNNSEDSRESSEPGSQNVNDLSFKRKFINSIKALPFFYATAKKIQSNLKILKDIFNEIKYSNTIYKIVKNIDLIIISGSGQFNEDWGGPWRYPFALFRWTLISRLAGCNVAFFSVGVGNIQSFWGRLFCSWALKLANYKSLRDEKSISISKQWGIDEVKLVPDMAFSIKVPKEKNVSTKYNIVGINPIAFCDPRSWHVPDQDSYNQYIEKMSAFCNSILAEGYRIHFIPNELKMDNPVIDDIVKKMSLNENQNSLIERPKTDSSEDVLYNLSKCDYVIASRFHGLLFSYLTYKPVIALAFHFKYFSLAKEMQQEKYCLDINNFNPEEVKKLFDDLVEHKDSISNMIKISVSNYSNLVEQQYQTICDLLPKT